MDFRFGIGSMSGLGAVGVAVAAMCLSAPAQDAVSITEFMASNLTGLRDEDGDTSDWIELQNTGTNTVNLANWTLTDSPFNLQLWAFPATNLAANARLVVFASGKDRAVPGQNLHTNFRLKASGGYLALVKPDGVTVAGSFNYPAQFPDISYGIGLGPSLDQEVLWGGASMRYLVPRSAVSEAWHGGAAFDDSSWSGGGLPAGYNAGAGPTTIAYSTPANTPGNQAYGGALGMDFTVTQPVQVTALGCFDDESNGISGGTTITVQLWARNNKGTPSNLQDDTGRAVLATTNFTSSSPGTLLNGDRFKGLAVPVVLTNGDYTIVAYGYNGTERNGNTAVTGEVDFPAPTLDTGGGAVRFVGSRYGTAGAFPQIVDVGVAQYGAGTLKFQTRPGSAYTTSLSAMQNANASVLIRAPFIVPSNTLYAILTLSVNYSGGMAAWLNGTEIASRNAPATLSYNSAATAANTAPATENIDVSAFAGALRAGTNILALQGLNITSNNADFEIDATLAGEREAALPVYFLEPTPGGPNGVGVVFPRIVINEIYSDPPNSKSSPAEFVELYNPLPSAVDLSGWAFTKGVQYAIPSGTSIPARGFLVVASSPPVMLEQFNVKALGPWTGSLANDGETVELSDATGTVVASVAYGSGFPWPTVGGNPGASLQLLNPALDPNLGGSWRSASPTPGAPNSVLTGSAPPQIQQVQNTPAQPASGQAVTITAKITDPDGVRSVTLEYQIVEPGNYVRLTDAAFTNGWTSMAMRDDGTGGDAVAGDSIFTALIPAGVQSHRRLIRYRITATDAPGNSVRVPYADDPSPNFAYFVYDGVPAWTGAVHPGVTPVTVFDTNTMRKVRAFHLISRSNDVYNCQYNSAYANAPYEFEGAVVAEGVVYDHVHYRVAGQNSTYAAGKNKWKFRFNRGHWLAFVDDYGQPRSTLRETLKLSALTEPWAAWNRGLAGLDEAVVFRLNNLAGVAAPETTYYQLRVVEDAVEADPANQYLGDLWGLYLGFEVYDQNFKKEHQLADGNLFYLQVSDGNNRLAAQGQGQPDDLSDLEAFVSASTGYNAARTQPLPWWQTNVDLPSYYSWRAVVEAVNDGDKRDQENVAYFRDPNSGQWSIHSWDCDLLYEQFDRWGPQGVQDQSSLEQIRRCLTIPALNVQFQNRARELQDLLLNSEQAGELVDEFISVITDHGPADPGFVEAERRRWDYDPLNPTPPRADRAVGNYYHTPYAIPNMGFGPYPQPFYRTLTSADLAGEVAWVKSFISSDLHGGARLASLASDTNIPNTPTITYVGPANFPADGLSFQTTSFSSPAGRAFAAMQWRIGEVYGPGVANYVAGTPCRYEIEPLWTSAALTTFSNRVVIPPAYAQPGLSYRVRARFQDRSGSWSHWSAPVQFTAGMAAVLLLSQNLVVTEIMYDPPSYEGLSGDYFEFLELENAGTNTLDVGGLTFTAGISFTFTNGTLLAPGGAFLLARDAAAMALKYPGVSVDGLYTGKLNNAGDTLTLAQPGGAIIFSFAYGNSAPWPATPHGQGFSLVLDDPRPGVDLGDAANWRASSASGGSPGTTDPASTLSPILVNEVLAHSAAPLADSIELYNPNPVNVDLGGWFLSDDATAPKKYRIANGTTMPAGGYLVFTENQFQVAGGPGVLAPFGLSADGDGAYLFSGDANTNLTGYSHGVDFGATFPGTTVGRYVNSVNEEQFPLQTVPTLGRPNAGPRIGPVVINEIQYLPAPGGDEFLELRNITATNVPLYDPAFPTNTWRLHGLDFTFPTNVIIGPNQLILLAATNPAAFRARYAIDGGVQVLGPYSGHLGASGETLELRQPDTPDVSGVPYVTIEAVKYSAAAPWPVNAAGTGLSLQRKSFTAYGNDPVNWAADVPTPGADYLAALAPSITAQPANLTLQCGQTATFTGSAAGQPPLGWQWRKGGTPIAGATNATLVLTGVARKDEGQYSLLVTNAFGGNLSSNALLRVLVPQRLGQPIVLPNGTLQLLSRDADGGTLTSNDLAGFEVWTSTDLKNWVMAPGTLALTNGQIVFQDTNVFNQATRFYRLSEQ
jgi:hypothetical protein